MAVSIVPVFYGTIACRVCRSEDFIVLFSTCNGNVPFLMFRIIVKPGPG